MDWMSRLMRDMGVMGVGISGFSFSVMFQALDGGAACLRRRRDLPPPPDKPYPIIDSL